MKFNYAGKKIAKSAVSIVAAGAMVAAFGLAGCQSNSSNSSSSSDSSSSDGPITVTITDDSCTVSTDKTLSGTVTFNVTNNGTAVNEFEILAEDQLQIVSERENLTPGTTVEVTVQLSPGNYFTASKTNMVGALVDATAFTVEDSGKEIEISDDEKALQEEAVANYVAYIKDQSGQLLEATKTFAEAYEKGDTQTCKDTYATTRMYYERIEPTAEAFGDIDPNLDLREADCAEEDVSADEWTGWHAIEKDLFGKANYNAKKRASLAKALVKDTQSLYDLVYSDDFSVTLSDISNGAISLMEEVATSKITGEEEIFSGTDLYDFQANVEGAKVAYGDVKTLLEQKDPDLKSEIDAAFKTVEEDLAQYNSGTTSEPSYKDYNDLSKDQVKALSDDVDTLRAALADLTAAILK